MLDHAELVAIAIVQNDEVGIGWVGPVGHPAGNDRDQSLDVALLVDGVQVQIP